MDHETRVPNVDTDAPLSVALLDRYLAGQATPDECALVEQWARHAKHASVLQTLRSMVPGQEGLRERRDDEIERVIARLEKRRLARVARRSKTQTLRRWTSPAGIILALIIAIVLVRPGQRTPVQTPRTFATGSGQQATVTASDGTRFILSPNTTVRLLDFTAHTRIVEVDGEAYVSVAHVSGLPFVVQGEKVSVQVLGTEFLIRHTPGTTRMRVAVTDGKVRVLTRTNNRVDVTLTSGQIGDVTDSTVHVSAVDDLTPRTERTRDLLVFRDTPLSVILATVSQWYGYQFRYADSTLARKTLTLGVSTQSSMEALAEIERVLHVNIAVAGDTITLIPQSPKGGNGTSRMRAYDVWTPTNEAGR